jgi:hypothetical protein
MPLFQPKTLRNLKAEIMAAHAAFSMSAKMPPAQQTKIANTAPREIANAARAAAAAGQADAARELLKTNRANPPSTCPPDTTWEAVIDEATLAIG